MSILGKHPRDSESTGYIERKYRPSSDKVRLLLKFLDEHKRLPIFRETNPCLRRYFRGYSYTKEITSHKYFPEDVLTKKIRKLRKFIDAHNRLPRYHETRPCLKRYFIDRIKINKNMHHGVPSDIISLFKQVDNSSESKRLEVLNTHICVFRRFLKKYGRSPKYGETKPCSKKYLVDAIKMDNKNIPKDIIENIETFAYHSNPHIHAGNISAYINFMDEHKRVPKYRETRPCCRDYFRRISRYGVELPKEITDHPYYTGQIKTKRTRTHNEIKSFIGEFLNKS